MNEILREKLKTLPDSPGCYLMKQEGQIIYVGKAKSLKNRVRSYFSGALQSPKTRALVQKIDDFETIICASELEAFLLENNLIKRNQPYYNILLKDDKRYPYLRIDLNEPFPRLTIARRVKKDGAKYFGPYLGASSIRQIFDLLRRLYPIRNCRHRLPLKNPIRPCVQHQIGRCGAPCANLISQDEYGKVIADLIAFLKGDTRRAMEDLQEKMQAASAALQFEKAKEYYDTMQDIRGLFEKQAVESAAMDDMDIVHVYFDDIDAMASILLVRKGKLIASRLYLLEKEGQSEEKEVLEALLSAYYAENEPPREIVCKEFEGREALFESLSALHEKKIYHSEGLRGKKRQLLSIAKKNAIDALRQRSLKKQVKYQREALAMQELMRLLGFDESLRRMEAFDISNTQGALSVASMTVMIDGALAKKEYRHFKIQTVEGANDFLSIKEVVSRRLRRALEEDEKRRWPMPDVIMIDGGKQQLRFAMEAMQELGLSLPIFSLAERLEEIFLPGREESILLDRKSNALHLIVRLRDEAHRFAISHHRSLRSKTMAKSSLEEIPLIGSQRRRNLLLAFGSIKQMQDKSVEDFMAVKGMTKQAAENVYDALHARK